jgi:hypothetical protein
MDAHVAFAQGAAPITSRNVPWPTTPLPGDPPLKAILANAVAPAPKSNRAENPALVSLIVDALPGADASPVPALSTRSPPSHTPRAAATASLASPSAGDNTPAAWLLAPRRDSRPAAATEVGHEPYADAGARSFDSDDGDLNAFAARMRGVEPSAAAPVSTAEAVARLQALILRLRTA